VVVTWMVSEFGSPSSAASGYVPTPSKSHFADTTPPRRAGTAIRAVKVTASPTAISARSRAVHLEIDHGLDALAFLKADAGTYTWPSCTRYFAGRWRNDALLKPMRSAAVSAYCTVPE